MKLTKRSGLVLIALAALVVSACGGSASETTLRPAESSTSSTTVVEATSTTTSTSSTTTTLAPVGIDCPADQPPSQATVTGVDNWVRLRGDATVDSQELAKIDAGSVVETYPATLAYDGAEFWWVAVQQPDSTRCGYIAASFLSTESGRMDRQIPGVFYRIPKTGVWTFSERIMARDPVEGFLEGAFFTSYGTFVRDGKAIDQILAEQLQQFEDLGYDYPDPWYSEVVIPGADRAVRLIPTVSESGDILGDRLVMEVGNHTIDASTSVYIEDVELAPMAELEDFLVSFRINPSTFLEAMNL
ncbi:MAG: hypothetical protein HKO03_03655 [Acidimicrobiia bacterium]|nr:hypothetical protein [Acidimicrobiia bacterium]